MPTVIVHVPRDDGAPTDLATLLARVAAPERRGLDPLCDGVGCEVCAPTGAVCPCPAQLCSGKKAGHVLQPCEQRRGIWPPPAALLVRVARSQMGGAKRHTRVVVPAGTFAVHDLVAEPPAPPRSEWRPAIVHYRAVAAGYHLGDRASTGHYWALVRGTEPAGAAAAASPGYRRCDDAAVTAGPGLARGMRWDDDDAHRDTVLIR